MSFIARVLSVEETERNWNPKTQAHDGYKRWLLTFYDRPHPVRTGNEAFADFARGQIGNLVYVAQGGKEGIVGSVRALRADYDFQTLLRYAQVVSEERDALRTERDVLFGKWKDAEALHQHALGELKHALARAEQERTQPPAKSWFCQSCGASSVDPFFEERGTDGAMTVVCESCGSQCVRLRKDAAPAASGSALEAILLRTNPDHFNGTLHENIQRECWKQHHEDFNVCQQPSCLFLKAVAELAGWSVGLNGVFPPVAASGSDPEKREG